MKTTIGQFRSRALSRQGIVVLFDLDGFSKFFSHPDVQDYVPKYLNLVLEAFDICFNGGTAYWDTDDEGNPFKYTRLLTVLHSKFLGDGALYIFDSKDTTEEVRGQLINRLWNLKNSFENVVNKATETIPIVDIPRKIRIGIAAGTVLRLSYQTTNREEYIGYSINLASRLQSYCRELGMIISGRMNIPISRLEQDSYIRVVAKNIKGFPHEIVIVEKDDYDPLPAKTKTALFEPVS